MFAMSIGCLIWFVDDYVIHHRPAISLADVMYLSYYPLLLWGILRFPTARRSRREVLKLWLDVGTVVVTGTAVIWYVVLEPAVQSGTTTPATLIISAIYPVGDLVLVFASMAVLLYQPSVTSRRALSLLVLAGLGFFCSDLVLGYRVVHTGIYDVGSWTDFGWQGAMLLWILAAYHQRWSADHPTAEPHAASSTSFEISAIPYLAVLVGYGLLIVVVWSAWTTSLGAVVSAVVILTLLVLVRQFTAVRENVELLTERMATEARFRSLVQNSSDVITVVDDRDTIQFMSPAVERVFGWHPKEALGVTISDIVHRDDLEAVSAFIARLRTGQTGPEVTPPLVWRCRNQTGEWRHVETVAASLVDDPAVRGVVFNTRDVSERIALQAQLAHQAYHDALTGLANRAWFHDRVEQALAHAHETPDHVVVFFLDLDNFKYINDSLGHAEGDRMLVEVARRLLNATRGSDTVARLGGDEFAMLVDRITTEQDLVTIAKRVTTAMRVPFLVQQQEVFSGASIGIARGAPGQTVDDLLRNADVAMYVSKRQGKGGYTLFEPRMHAAARERLELENDLRQALLGDELSVVFQPMMHLTTRQLAGVEALVRWQHPRRGWLYPNEFIPLAEESELILPLGRWVLREACLHGARWRAMLPADAPLTVSVNVSGCQLQHATFVDEVAAALRDTGLPPHMLLLEITESVIVRDTALTLQRLNTLKALGLRLAIDDFGTGYSSLSFLRQFPIDVLKIDKSFIDDTTASERGPALAQTIIALGNSLSLQTVAEGVEQVEQAEIVANLGCTIGQGFYFSRPVWPQAIDAIITGSAV